MFPDCDDPPLFSGTPVPAAAEAYLPKEEPGQESLFDRRDYIARPKIKVIPAGTDIFALLDPENNTELRQTLDD